MVRFVVQHHDVFHAHEFRHDALEHLPFGFLGGEGFAPALEQAAAVAGRVQTFSQLEGVEVGDDDLGSLEVVQHAFGDEFPVLVVAVGVVGLQHSQAILDGDAGGDDQEAAGEPPAVRMPGCVDGLPGDQHGHDGRLAGAGGEFQRQSGKSRIGLFVGGVQVFEEPLSGVAEARCDFGQPDDGFRGFDLAEEGAEAVRLAGAPVLEEVGRFRRDAPLFLRECPPVADVMADALNDLRQVVLLVSGLDLSCGGVEDHRGLVSCRTLLPSGFWNG